MRYFTSDKLDRILVTWWNPPGYYAIGYRVFGTLFEGEDLHEVRRSSGFATFMHYDYPSKHYGECTEITEQEVFELDPVLFAGLFEDYESYKVWEQANKPASNQHIKIPAMTTLF